MTNQTFKNTPNTVVMDIEIRDDKPGYTVNTIATIKREYPGAQLFLLVGTDMYLTLDMWKNSETLLNAITPAVFPRSAEDIKKIMAYSLVLKERYGVDTMTIKNCIVDISSSRLREMLPKREGAGYITDTTYSYIIENKIYGAKPDWDWLRMRAYAKLSPQRISHVSGCEEEALRLAKRWGVNADDALEAAILHDITKSSTLEENLSILEENGIIVGKIEHAEEKLLHSKSGAVLAKTLFGVTDEVAGAIMWHTTGRAGMSTLEKVVYLADYIEPERDFPGVADLRKEAYEDIDNAMIMGLEMSIQDITARAITPNSTTSDALDYLIHSRKGQTNEAIQQQEKKRAASE